ncbi:exonuclease 3'-5' domain-containing protein 2-like [Watersipora subatra]|uniref:exonuclease 3'-5' domain-containing protein 2-like n=1 Tax=Watersipora subatra TaxID=2589382 RepID=UPI00355B4639
MTGNSLLQKSFATATLLAAGGLLIYYLFQRTKRKQGKPAVQNIQSNIYDKVKSLCKECIEQAEVILVESECDWDRAYTLICEDLATLKVIGMDCEWVTKGKKRKPVSMLQLSTLHCTALVRLHLFTLHIPGSLIALIEDKTILKVGVGVMDDRDKLFTDYLMSMFGCVDLRYVAGRYKKSWNKGGLQSLAQEVAGISLNKSNQLRCGDWEQEQLPHSMSCYAAKDSQSGLAIFMCLVALKLTSLMWENEAKAIFAIQTRALPMCHGIVDLRYKAGSPTPGTAAISVVSTPSIRAPSKCISSNALRSKAMYSNCVMQAPDGQVLCVCDVRKAQWYCDKELADKVSEEGAEELVIRLRFEPRGRPTTERDYYRSRKENICVVCGADESFLRKNIVPREYRKHFPEILKSHSSHDVVLLCALCHQKSGISDQRYKMHFADLCNAPYTTGAVTVNQELKKVKSAARTLNGYMDKIPAKRVEECRSILREFYKTDDITREHIESASSLDERDSTPQDHGRIVVQYFMDNSSVQEFQRLWRVRFLEVMSPKHLGEYWHVDYNHLDYLWVKTDREMDGSDTDSS